MKLVCMNGACTSSNAGGATSGPLDDKETDRSLALAGVVALAALEDFFKKAATICNDYGLDKAGTAIDAGTATFNADTSEDNC